MWWSSTADARNSRPRRHKGLFMATTAVRGPLEGFTVIDMSVELVGPYATQLMADFGANVIKVGSLYSFRYKQHAGGESVFIQVPITSM